MNTDVIQTSHQIFNMRNQGNKSFQQMIPIWPYSHNKGLYLIYKHPKCNKISKIMNL